MSDVLAGKLACLSIPPVAGFDSGDWETTARVMKTEGLALDFRQSWLPANEDGFTPARVWIGVSGDELVAYAMMEDDRPANRATRGDDPTWLTGDVLELFFQAEGRPGYHEFHVTPENVRLQLFFPSRASFREHRGHRHWVVEEKRFESAARVNATRTAWEATMRIKIALVLDEPRDDGARRFKFSFGRYDYQPGREEPVTSSTSTLSQMNFHNVDEWMWAELPRA